MDEWQNGNARMYDIWLKLWTYIGIPGVFGMGFSLLSALLRVSQKRNEVRTKSKPTCYAGGVKELYKKSPFRYNRVVQALLQKGKVIYGE